METAVGIRKFRERMNFRSQNDLANALGVIQANVSSWESGRSYPGFKIIIKLLQLGITVEELFGVTYKNAKEENILPEKDFEKRVINVMNKIFTGKMKVSF